MSNIMPSSELSARWQPLHSPLEQQRLVKLNLVKLKDRLKKNDT